MSGTFNDRGQLEPAAAPIIAIFGRKGSGKSVLADSFGAAWPYDMVVIDVAGDDGPTPRPKDSEGRQQGTHDVHDVTGTVEELPTRWPEHWRVQGRPMILHYLPDAGSPTELEDMDAMVGLAFAHSSKDRPAMLLIHEIGRVAPSGRTQPHMRRVLNHSRHEALTVVVAGPRPITVDPLVTAQADLTYIVSELKNPNDRRRIADDIGWNPAEFDAAVEELGRYEQLRHDSREPKPEAEGDQDWRLVHLDPLPDDEVKAALAWAHPPTPEA